LADIIALMPAIHKMLPSAEDLLALEPEELAPILLKYLSSDIIKKSWKGSFKRGNVFLTDIRREKIYGDEFADKVDEALTAAWVWLEREGLPYPRRETGTVTGRL
jgi:hypothetical protein